MYVCTYLHSGTGKPSLKIKLPTFGRCVSANVHYRPHQLHCMGTQLGLPHTTCTKYSQVSGHFLIHAFMQLALPLLEVGGE